MRVLWWAIDKKGFPQPSKVETREVHLKEAVEAALCSRVIHSGSRQPLVLLIN